MQSKHYPFRKCNRVLTKCDYNVAFDTTTKVIGKYFIVYVSESPGESNRLGLVVSKKTSKQAVARNRIKRLIRESFRTSKTLVSMREKRLSKPGVTTLVISRKPASDASNQSLAKELGWVWRRVGAASA